ncbi:MAG: hypothetical protein HYT65_01535 [Candidatus Yanofskybacteria bacterium]|nr:hypothetical protein [Candidatus Yanofskybacteria bacterium]
MKSGDNLIKTFAGCFRLIAKLNAGIKDGFFVDLISEESEKLLAGYIKFLKIEGDELDNSYVAQNHILQQKIVAKYPYIVQRSVYVAQCRVELTSQIKKLLNLLNILNYLNLSNPTTPLLLERELLKLQLLLARSKPLLTIKVRGVDNIKNQEKSDKNLKKSSELQKLGTVHKEIAEFIGSKERVQNVEVFAQFADTTRRTLKRKLSELVKAGGIKRLALGKKVFYSVV